MPNLRTAAIIKVQLNLQTTDTSSAHTQKNSQIQLFHIPGCNLQPNEICRVKCQGAGFWDASQSDRLNLSLNMMESEHPHLPMGED